jgi:hypothetical protein
MLDESHDSVVIIYIRWRYPLEPDRGELTTPRAFALGRRNAGLLSGHDAINVNFKNHCELDINADVTTLPALLTSDAKVLD